MAHDAVIADTLRELRKFAPRSVFVYGSRGRNDFRADSDYELGVVFDDDKYVRRREIQASVSNPKVHAYPFKWGELVDGSLSNVFQKSIYLREITAGGRTVEGERLIEGLAPPPIMLLDLIQRIRFDIGMATAAVLSFRSGDMATSMDEFSKSCLFGTRCLEILELGKFGVGYDEIHRLSDGLKLEAEYREAIEAAMDWRKAGKEAAVDLLFQNISLLDTAIEPQIVAAYDARGNVKVL